MQHNAHMYAFYQAPDSAKPAATRARIVMLQARLDDGCYPSADAYYADDAELRRLTAALVNLRPREYDPVGHWHKMQSN